MGREDYLDGWQKLHGGYDPRGNALVRGWLSGAYVVARPFAAAGLSPDLVTALGLGVSALALIPAAAGGGWLLIAAAVVVLSALLDNVDGAVAVLTGRSTAWGQVLDSGVDRLSDLVFLGALYLAGQADGGALGAPGLPCLVGGTLMLLQEYVRAKATAAGMTDVGVVTVWERPTRVIVTAAFLGSGAFLGDPWPVLGAWAWAGLGVVGLVQLGVVVRRRLV